MTVPTVRNPRAEAEARLPAGYQARVLEPSPPANLDPEWYADDPTDPTDPTEPTRPTRGHEVVVSPTTDGEVTWDQFVADQPALASFARQHWLGARSRLTELPDSFAATRHSLHQVAFFAVSPKRHAVTGKLGLRWTRGGFGTPFYATQDGDEQARVEGDLLVVQTGATIRSQRLTTIEDAAAFLGVPYRERWFEGFHDPPQPSDPGLPLDVDSAATGALGDWFGFATAVLEELRRTKGAEAASRVQLWPEHFDPAVELGSADAGSRASYGASPGDDAHPEPYMYVAAWGEIDRADPHWNDATFNGASLSYKELLEADDQFASALDFLRQGHSRLTG